MTLDPKNPHAYHQRGLAFAAVADYDQAVVDHLEAIRLAPKAAEAYHNFARFWLTCADPGLRNGKMAVELATRACELAQWSEGQYLETLALAHAEAGNLQAAARWMARVRELAPAKNNPQ